MGLPSSAGSNTSKAWEEEFPILRVSASDPTLAPNYAGHFDARKKPPRAGISPHDAWKAEFEKEMQEKQKSLSSETYIGPRLARELAKNYKAKVYHPTLTASLNVLPPKDLLNTIEVTDGLQGRNLGNGYDLRKLAEYEYRQSRPVYDSPVRDPPLPRQRPPRRSVEMRQECNFSDCRLLHDEEHLNRFTHRCDRGLLCELRGDPLHCARFRHPDVEDLDALMYEKKGWAAENKRSASCVPTINAFKLSQSMPALSCIPRGGFRPAGGAQSRTEFCDLRKRVDDNVKLNICGIPEQWTDNDLFKYCRDLITFKLISASVEPDESKWKNSGKGEITCYDYSEAEQFKTIVHGRSIGKNLLTVEYRDPIKSGFDTYEGKSSLQIFEIKGMDPAVPRYNTLLRRCGAYWQDAEAIVKRMRSEGHKPNIYTYIALLFCYRDARPTQPQKALLTLDIMRSEKIEITTTACNIIVDIWCRAGNMPQAEAFVKRMEERINMESKFVFCEQDPERLSIPNEETYLILRDGWERLGVMEDVANRQRGYRMDEPPPVSMKHRREPTISGVLGLPLPAPSIITSHARRRSGWFPPHTGLFVQQKNESNFGMLEPSHWRSRV